MGSKTADRLQGSCTPLFEIYIRPRTAVNILDVKRMNGCGDGATRLAQPHVGSRVNHTVDLFPDSLRAVGTFPNLVNSRPNSARKSSSPPFHRRSKPLRLWLHVLFQ